MKRPLIIVGIILILTLVVGIERFRQFLEVAESQGSNGNPDVRIEASERTEGRVSKRAARQVRDGSEGGSANGETSVPKGSASGQERAGALIRPLIGEMRFIRSRLIIGDGEADLRIRALLTQAVSETMKEFGYSGSVMDLDAMGKRKAPIVIHAKKIWDITPSVRARYQGLLEESGEK